MSGVRFAPVMSCPDEREISNQIFEVCFSHRGAHRFPRAPRSERVEKEDRQYIEQFVLKWRCRGRNFFKNRMVKEVGHGPIEGG